MEERRHFLRVVFERPVYLVHETQTWTTRLLDLSLRGALVERPDSWNEHIKKLTLRFNLAENDSSSDIEIQAELRHKNTQQLGFKIDTLSLESASHLKRLIELNLGDDALLQRELDELIK